MIINSSNLDTIITAINSKKSGLSTSASAEEVAAYIVANWKSGTSSGNITYERHTHTSSCQGTCGGTLKYVTSYQTDTGNTREIWSCQVCSKEYDYWNLEPNKPSVCTENKYTCGYTQNQIISATITF